MFELDDIGLQFHKLTDEIDGRAEAVCFVGLLMSRDCVVVIVWRARGLVGGGAEHGVPLVSSVAEPACKLLRRLGCGQISSALKIPIFGRANFNFWNSRKPRKVGFRNRMNHSPIFL